LKLNPELPRQKQHSINRRMFSAADSTNIMEETGEELDLEHSFV
jgi:hypothetical protein